MPDEHEGSASQWLRAKVNFRQEVIRNSLDLSTYSEKFQKGVIKSLREGLPREFEIRIIYRGHPSKGCYLEIGWVTLKAAVESAALVSALDGGKLVFAIRQTAHDIFAGNIKRLEVQTSPAIPTTTEVAADDPPPDGPLQTYVEEALAPRRSWILGASKARSLLPWVLLAVLIFGQIFQSMKESQNDGELRAALDRIEDSARRRTTAPAVFSNCAPTVRLTCPSAPHAEQSPTDRRWTSSGF